MNALIIQKIAILRHCIEVYRKKRKCNKIFILIIKLINYIKIQKIIKYYKIIFSTLYQITTKMIKFEVF